MDRLFKAFTLAAIFLSICAQAWCQSARIGPRGGKLISADKLLHMVVPPGALDKETLLSIASLDNSNPGGIGHAYELMPHGIRFKKLVSLSFHYKNLLDSITFPCGLQIAFQDSLDQWKISAGRQHDEQGKILKVTTTHFSRWCVMESVKLSPKLSSVQPLGFVYFKVTGFVPANFDPCSPAKDGKDVPITTGQILPAERIRQWTLLSSFGTLFPTGGTAAYQAPSIPPQKNTITVMVELKSQPFPLLAKVNVINASFGVVFQVGNEPPINFDHVEASKDGDTYNILISDDRGNAIGSLTFTGKLPGIFSWTGNGTPGNNYLSIRPPNLKRWTFESYYEKNGKAIDSHGFVTAKREGNARELLTGEFTIKNAGKINIIDGDGTYEGETTVEGRFKVILKQND